ncbi:Acg family FMN-binding oxidoreductase [Serinibacter arcticus]|nr:nitroreductase family protein [Serinibacter arcticus]
MLERDRIVSALEDASSAPSIHNSQPWRFRLVGSGVEVVLDASVTPRTVDPVGRWALASIGAVVANLELALTARTGRAITTAYLPDGGAPAGETRAGGAAHDGRVLAVVTLGEVATTTAAMHAARLAGAMEERRTTRGPLLGGPPTDEEWAEIRAAVAFSGEILGAPAPSALVPQLLALTARSETERQDSGAYLEEIQAWMAGAARAGTGIPRGAVGTPDADGRVPVRDFTQTPLGSSGDGDVVVFEDPPALLVLHSGSDTPRDQLLAGYAMQRAMLEATVLGLGVGVLGQALEEPASRAEFDAVASTALGGAVVVHQVLRLGHPLGAPTHVPTPRRPVAELLLG